MNMWLPSSATDTEKPRFQCRVCGDRFVHNGAFEQHVLKCSRVFEAELAEFAADQSRLARDIPDPEWDDYNRALQRQGIDPDVQFARGRKSNIRRASES